MKNKARSGKNITDTFIESLYLMKDEGFSEKSLLEARKRLLDFLGTALAGNQILKNRAPQLYDPALIKTGASLIGQRRKTDPGQAALINAMGSHITELDDGHRYGMIHLGAPIISAIIAAAQTEPLAKCDILAGIISGYEAAVRLARALQPKHRNKGFHTTGTCGTVGAALGVAFAFSYSIEQVKTTLSCAVSAAAGLLELQEDASELKPFNAGRASLDGLKSAHIGKVGLKAPDDILGGKRGLFSVFADGKYEKDFLLGCENTPEIEGVYSKLYSSCRHSHPAVEAALYIRDKNDINTKSIKKVIVRTYRVATQGHDHKMALSVNSAKMSIPFSIALALVLGRAGISEFTEENIIRQDIKHLADRVAIVCDEELTAASPQKRAAIVDIVLEDRRLIHRVDYPKGEPENPLSAEELREKFTSLALFAGKTKEEVEKLIEAVERVEGDLPGLLELL
ncbi:MAG: MmgE/PrpD family protein [Clostridiales bacterium]|nr:MmgE/PrpD family protein [Clostridiales bacterium]